MQPRLIAVLAGLALTTPALAQTQQTAPCAPSGRAEAATPPQRDSRDGTAPGNAGNTGWSGGTGGSHMGTNPSGAVATSPTWQPPTARGLDPIKGPQAVAC